MDKKTQQCYFFYRQEGVSHTVKMASGYLRMLIFEYCIEPQDILKLQRMVSFIVCIFGFETFRKHASQWLSPKNVALSCHAEVPPDAVRQRSFLQETLISSTHY